MRGIWFVAGASAGVYVMVKARRAAEALTPEGLHDRLAGVQVGWAMFADEVRSGMTEKETELHERLLLGLDGGATPHSAARDRALPPAHRAEGTDQT